jgi:[ribosomal protein S5]-alanine N-acetyltransferase
MGVIEMTDDPVLETERLWLRPLTLADAPVIQSLVNDRRIAETTLNIPHPYPENGAADWIRRIRERRAQGYTDYTFGIDRKPDMTLIGVISIHVWRDHRAEIGYWVGVDYWGQGYMTEAARRVICFGFEDLHLHRIIARYFTRNPASERVMQKVGMTFEGIMRQHLLKWGEFVDVGCYSILRSEYETQREV